MQFKAFYKAFNVNRHNMKTNIDNNYVYLRNDLWNYIKDEQKSLISSTNDFVNAISTALPLNP